MATLVRVDEIRNKVADVTVGTTITASQERKFHVEYSDYTVEPVDAVYATGIPAFGEALGSGSLVLKRKTAEQNADKPELFTVTCTYEFPTPGEEAAPDNPDPDGERWAIDITIQSLMFEVETQKDAYDNPITNSAYHPISGVMTRRYDTEVVVSFTTNVIDWDGIDLCLGKVNSAPVVMTINGQSRTFATGTLLFDRYALQTVLDDTGTQRPRMTYVLLHRLETWRRRLADKGLYELYVNPADSSLMRIPIRDGEGNQITVPVNLDGEGGQAVPGDQVVILPAPNNLSGLTPGIGYEINELVDMGTELLWEIGT
jgi:hypothetical protein